MQTYADSTHTNRGKKLWIVQFYCEMPAIHVSTSDKFPANLFRLTCPMKTWPRKMRYMKNLYKMMRKKRRPLNYSIRNINWENWFWGTASTKTNRLIHLHSFSPSWRILTIGTIIKLKSREVWKLTVERFYSQCFVQRQKMRIQLDCLDCKRAQFLFKRNP